MLKYDRKFKKDDDKLSYFGIEAENEQNIDENDETKKKDESNIGVKFYVIMKYFIDEKGFI